MRYWIVLLILFGGCAGSCISVGGSYEDKYSGNIEYCFDVAESEKSGVVAFDSGDGEKIYSFDEDTIKDILDKLKDKVGIKTVSPDPENPGRHPVKELLEILERGK